MSREELRARLREDALAAGEAALAAVEPGAAVERALRSEGLEGPVRVLALGKAAPAMVRGAAAVLGERLRGGLAVAPPPLPEATAGLSWLPGSHPLPAEDSAAAGRRLLDEARALADDETALVLVSGGASSLAATPIEGLGLRDLRLVGESLLRSGADIGEINAVRRRISALHGGGLGEAIGSRPALTLVVSDVPGDEPSVVGSGPTVPEPGTEAPGPRRLAIVASGRLAAEAAAEELAARGYLVESPAAALEGDAAERARWALRRLAASGAGARGLVLAGEPTVSVTGSGEGGRCRHAALAASLALAQRGRRRELLFAALATDGRDGSGACGGAVVDASTAERARAAGRDPAADLAACESGPALAAAGHALPGRATGTNVADLWLLLADEAEPVLVPLEETPSLRLPPPSSGRAAVPALAGLGAALRRAAKSLAPDAVLALEGGWDPTCRSREAGSVVRLAPLPAGAAEALRAQGLRPDAADPALWRWGPAPQAARRPPWAG